MQFLLDQFLRTFRLLLFLHVHGGSGANPPGSGEKTSKKVPMTTPTPIPVQPTATNTTSVETSVTTIVSTSTTPSSAQRATTTTTASHLALPIPTTSTDQDPKRSPSENDPRVAWIYLLRKPELQYEMNKFQLHTEGTVDQLRTRFVGFLRSGQLSPSPMPPKIAIDVSTGAVGPDTCALKRREQDYEEIRRPSSATHHQKMTQEELSIREMLDLPPTASFREVQEKLLHSQRRTTGPAISEGLPPTQSTRYPQETYTFHSADATNTLAPEFSRLMTADRPVYTSGETSTRRDTTHEYHHAYVRNPPTMHETWQQPISHNPVNNEVAHICSLVRKWNLRFDGDKDPVSFIERLQELSESYDVNSDLLLKALPELFTGEAIFWYRNNKTVWSTFNDFLDSFKDQYLPPDYLRKLDEEIIRRTQGEHEAVKKYVVALTTLMRRRGTFSKDQILNRLYSNLRPEYKLTVRREHFNSVSDLIRLAESYESYLRERQQYRPPPNPAQALVPETAYAPKSRPTRNVQINVFEESEKNITAIPVPKSESSSTKQVQDYNRFVQPRSDDAGRRDPRTEIRPNQYSPKGDRTVTLVCWNCDRRGHIYRNCRLPKKLKCFNCKTEGVRTTDCDCRQGNEIRGRKIGGVPNLASNTPPPKTGTSGSRQ